MQDTISTTAHSITISHAQLTSIASLAACASTDNVAPVISGVRLVATPGAIEAHATNRYVAASVKFLSESITAEFDVIVPVTPLKQFVTSSKLTGRFNTDVERITLTVSDDSITFSDLNTGSTLTTATIKGNYPPIEKLYPELTEGSTTVESYGISAKLLATLSKIVVIDSKNPRWEVQHTTGTGKPGPVLYHTEGNGRSYRFLIQPMLKNLR